MKNKPYTAHTFYVLLLDAYTKEVHVSTYRNKSHIFAVHCDFFNYIYLRTFGPPCTYCGIRNRDLTSRGQPLDFNGHAIYQYLNLNYSVANQVRPFKSPVSKSVTVQMFLACQPVRGSARKESPVRCCV